MITLFLDCVFKMYYYIAAILYSLVFIKHKTIFIILKVVLLFKYTYCTNTLATIKNFYYTILLTKNKNTLLTDC